MYKRHPSEHPSDKAHGGTAIIMRESIKHYEREIHQGILQTTSVTIEEEHGPIIMYDWMSSAVLLNTSTKGSKTDPTYPELQFLEVHCILFIKFFTFRPHKLQ